MEELQLKILLLTRQLRYNMKKKICFVTGTRAEYGLLKPLMQRFKADAGFELQLLVTGAHLSPEFGRTFKQIETDGFEISAKVEMLLSGDTAQAIVKSMGVGMIGYADAFEQLQPDLVVVLGDRYEILAVASAALIYQIPLAHLHGGEVTEGAYDDAIRHAITKMAQLHFTATEDYARRVVQLGEAPENVIVSGAPGVDNILAMPLMEQEALEASLGLKLKPQTFLVTFHPETSTGADAAVQYQEVLNGIADARTADMLFIFTKANADTNGRVINEMTARFAAGNPESVFLFDSLGVLRYLSLLRFCKAMIGNSSSGILEAPAMGIPTINIGDRQKGRIMAESIFQTGVNANEIANAIQMLAGNTRSFSRSSIYGNGSATSKIYETIRERISGLSVQKQFKDIF